MPWYYVTRALGVFFALYALLVDHTPERGTIFLGGLGMAGIDKVAKSEHKDE